MERVATAPPGPLPEERAARPGGPAPSRPCPCHASLAQAVVRVGGKGPFSARFHNSASRACVSSPPVSPALATPEGAVSHGLPYGQRLTASSAGSFPADTLRYSAGVDEEWVKERLEWWVKTARAARVTSYSTQRGTTTHGFTREDNSKYQSLRTASAQTLTIIRRVLNRNDVPSLMRRVDQAYWLEEGIEFAEHALALIATRRETREKLGSAAPSMKADALHPTIWRAAAGRWESGHYSDAVQRAATALSGQVKDLTGRYELGDNDLMAQAFSLSPPQEGKPRLRWPGNDSDLTVKSMRSGLLNMSQGAFAAIRNIATHTTADLPKQEALEQLATLSLLARWIDQCEVVTI